MPFAPKNTPVIRKNLDEHRNRTKKEKKSAEEAHRIGLLNHVHPASELEEKAHAFAARLAAGPTFALAMTKRSLNEEMSMDLRQALEAEARTQAFCMETEDFRIAYEAFANREKPEFVGR